MFVFSFLTFFLQKKKRFNRYSLYDRIGTKSILFKTCFFKISSLFMKRNDETPEIQSKKTVQGKANGVESPEKPPLERSEWGIRQYVGLPLAFVCLLIFGFVPILPEEDRPAQQCLGILLCAAILWASESIPLFITAMLIPVLVVWFQVLIGDDGTRIERKAASSEIISSMLSSTICLALAGFTMTAALKKCGLDSMIANVTLSKAAKLGNFPFMIILSILCILMSAVVSNVTAPVLVLGFLEPYFDKMPPHSPLKRCLATVVMIASNVGGMTTPISSPQNIVSMNEMTKAGLGINFGSFCICGIISALLCGIVGLLVDRFVLFNVGESRHMMQISSIIPMLSNNNNNNKTTIGKKGQSVSDERKSLMDSSGNDDSSEKEEAVMGTTQFAPDIPEIEENQDNSKSELGDHEDNIQVQLEDPEHKRTSQISKVRHKTSTKQPGKKLSDEQYKKMITIITAVLSIAALILWIVVGFFESSMGDNGIISLFVLVLFYGTGVMLQKDFKDSIPWNVIFLLMGGNALGHAVQSSHLLNLITDLLNSMEGISEYAIILVLLLIMSVVATFVSHTVSSIILMPIVIDFCKSMAYTDTTAVAMTLALMCSGAMGLPVSSFPNTTMSGLLDKDGTKLLDINSIVLVGGTMTLLNYLVLGGVCYFLISVII